MPQWGAVERQPRVYDFSGYRAFVQVAKRMGLKLQAVMSFHACGANVGDTAQVPLPDWVLKVLLQPPFSRMAVLKRSTRHLPLRYDLNFGLTYAC